MRQDTIPTYNRICKPESTRPLGAASGVVIRGVIHSTRKWARWSGKWFKTVSCSSLIRFHLRPFPFRAPLSHPLCVHPSSLPLEKRQQGLLRGRRWLFVAVRAGDVSFPCEHIRLPLIPFRLDCCRLPPSPVKRGILSVRWCAFSSVNVNPRRHLLIQINHNRRSLNHPFTPHLYIANINQQQPNKSKL